MKNKETSSRENRSHFEIMFMLIIMVAYMYAPVLNLTLRTFNIQVSFDATL